MEPIQVGRLAVWVYPATGTEGAGAGKKSRLLLIHGLGEHSGRHRNTVDFLTRHGTEVVCFDLRGSGKSEGPRQWIDRWDDYLDDTHAVQEYIRTQLAPVPLFLYGHSLGGAIAIHYAAKHPEFAGLILSAPGYLIGGGVSPIKVKLGRWMGRIAPALKIPGSLDLTNLSRDKAVVEAYYQDPLCARFNTVRQGNEILDALERIPEACHQIRMPTLLLHGADDRIIRPEGSERILRELAASDKQLKVFPGGFHELYNDLDKDAFFQQIQAFIARLIP